MRVFECVSESTFPENDVKIFNNDIVRQQKPITTLTTRHRTSPYPPMIHRSHTVIPFLISLLLFAIRIRHPSAYCILSQPRKRIVGTSRLQVVLSDDLAENSAPPCPFSKSFPRYKIGLTDLKEKTESSWFASPFQTFSRTIAKSKLKQTLTRDQALYWAPDIDGVAAMALLWERAAKMISETSGPDTEVIALPDTSRQLVHNWVEMVDWMGDGNDCLMTATLISEESTNSGIPAVRIQRLKALVGDLEDDFLEPVASNDSIEVLKERTQAWVKRVLVEQGICPFTRSVQKSGQGLSDVGVPVGSIAYHGSSATDAIRLFADTWKAIEQMIEAGPSGREGVSSILLTAPAFDDDFDFCAGPIFAMLEASVVAAQAQGQIGIVCFHPQYATPDGKSWPGFGHMHSVPRLEKWYQEYSETKQLTTEEVAAGGAWQRRTPHATINVLRADQLKASESKRISGSLYTENIEKLVSVIGSSKLAQDLERERQIGSKI
jgi:hypothetical protein